MGRGMAIYNRKLRKDFIKKVMFQQRLERDEGIGLVDIYEKGHLGQGNGRCKGPEAGTCLCVLSSVIWT